MKNAEKIEPKKPEPKSVVETKKAIVALGVKTGLKAGPSGRRC